MKTILAIIGGALIFALFNVIAPLYYQQPRVTECGQRDFRMTDGVIYCDCGDDVWSKPNKCEDKYK